MKTITHYWRRFALWILPTFWACFNPIGFGAMIMGDARMKNGSAILITGAQSSGKTLALVKLASEYLMFTTAPKRRVYVFGVRYPQVWIILQGITRDHAVDLLFNQIANPHDLPMTGSSGWKWSQVMEVVGRNGWSHVNLICIPPNEPDPVTSQFVIDRIQHFKGMMGAKTQAVFVDAFDQYETTGQEIMSPHHLVSRYCRNRGIFVATTQALQIPIWERKTRHTTKAVWSRIIKVREGGKYRNIHNAQADADIELVVQRYSDPKGLPRLTVMRGKYRYHDPFAGQDYMDGSVLKGDRIVFELLENEVDVAKNKELVES